MNLAIATVQVPFVYGGAERLTEGLVNACRQFGHHVELVTMPFRFYPPAEITRSMDNWLAENFARMNAARIDKVVCLKFPSYYLEHFDKVVWLLHQHREFYDLWPADSTDSEKAALRDRAIAQDTAALEKASKRFTISGRVAERLQHYNGLDATVLYPPPPDHLTSLLYTAAAEPYIFCFSRLETLKRQTLLVEAMRHVKSPVRVVMAGTGGLLDEITEMIARYDLADRIRLTGGISDAEAAIYYAHSLGVFFGPRDEDLGLIAMEAMLAAKPVITCSDSGGPTEFVVDQETGFVTEPTPVAVADAIERLYANPVRAAEMGQAGLSRYRTMNISWDQAVYRLLS